MSLYKSEAKLHAINELGSRLDDALENATKGLYREEGAADALQQALGSFDQLLKVFDKEIDSKNLDIDTSKMLKDYFMRCRSFIMSLSNAAETNKKSYAGKISAFQQSVSIAKKFKDEELQKLQMMRDAIRANMENPEPEAESEEQGRRVGQRPQASIKMQRLAEEMRNSLAVEPVEATEEKKEVENESNPQGSAEEKTSEATEEVEKTVTKPKKQKK